jgi:hypothetical protein
MTWVAASVATAEAIAVAEALAVAEAAAAAAAAAETAAATAAAAEAASAASAGITAAETAAATLPEIIAPGAEVGAQGIMQAAPEATNLAAEGSNVAAQKAQEEAVNQGLNRGITQAANPMAETMQKLYAEEALKTASTNPGTQLAGTTTNAPGFNPGYASDAYPNQFIPQGSSGTPSTQLSSFTQPTSPTTPLSSSSPTIDPLDPYGGFPSSGSTPPPASTESAANVINQGMKQPASPFMQAFEGASKFAKENPFTTGAGIYGTLSATGALNQKGDAPPPKRTFNNPYYFSSDFQGTHPNPNDYQYTPRYPSYATGGITDIPPQTNFANPSQSMMGTSQYDMPTDPMSGNIANRMTEGSGAIGGSGGYGGYSSGAGYTPPGGPQGNSSIGFAQGGLSSIDRQQQRQQIQQQRQDQRQQQRQVMQSLPKEQRQDFRQQMQQQRQQQPFVGQPQPQQLGNPQQPFMGQPPSQLGQLGNPQQPGQLGNPQPPGGQLPSSLMDMIRGQQPPGGQFGNQQQYEHTMGQPPGQLGQLGGQFGLNGQFGQPQQPQPINENPYRQQMEAKYKDQLGNAPMNPQQPFMGQPPGQFKEQAINASNLKLAQLYNPQQPFMGQPPSQLGQLGGQFGSPQQAQPFGGYNSLQEALSQQPGRFGNPQQTTAQLLGPTQSPFAGGADSTNSTTSADMGNPQQAQPVQRGVGGKGGGAGSVGPQPSVNSNPAIGPQQQQQPVQRGVGGKGGASMASGGITGVPGYKRGGNMDIYDASLRFADIMDNPSRYTPPDTRFQSVDTFRDTNPNTANKLADEAAETRRKAIEQRSYVNTGAKYLPPSRRPGQLDLGPVSGERSKYDNQESILAAQGGIMGYNLGGYANGGNPRLLKGPGDGMSDNIPATIANRQPARLADGEFVVPADVVSHLGNGSTEAGAKKLHEMMNSVRKARTGNPKQGKKINPNKFMPKK